MLILRLKRHHPHGEHEALTDSERREVDPGGTSMQCLAGAIDVENVPRLVVDQFDSALPLHGPRRVERPATERGGAIRELLAEQPRSASGVHGHFSLNALRATLRVFHRQPHDEDPRTREDRRHGPPVLDGIGHVPAIVDNLAARSACIEVHLVAGVDDGRPNVELRRRVRPRTTYSRPAKESRPRHRVRSTIRYPAASSRADLEERPSGMRSAHRSPSVTTTSSSMRTPPTPRR